MKFKGIVVVVLCIGLVLVITACKGDRTLTKADKVKDPAAAEVKAKEERKSFAMSMIRTLRGSGVDKKIQYDPDEFSLIIGEAEDKLFFLGNAYNQFSQAEKSNREEILNRFAKTVLLSDRPLPVDFSDARSHILPRMGSLASHSFMRFRNQLKGLEYSLPPHKVTASHFAVDLVYDWPESIQGIQKSDLDRWGVTFEKALELSLENLKAKSSEKFSRAPGKPGVYVSPWKDYYDAARLLLPEKIAGLDVKGDPVVILPNRDRLMVTGSEDEEGLGALAELAAAALKEPRPLSGTALRWTGKEWIPFLPTAGSPLFYRFVMLRTKVLDPDYLYQKELLDRLYKKVGADIFVAKYMVMKHEETGRVLSLCVWSRDVVSLLPETTHISFFDDRLPENERVIGPVEWNRAINVVGNLMTKQDLSPPRYKVEQFPTPGQLKKMTN